MPSNAGLMSLSGKAVTAAIYLIVLGLLIWVAMDFYQRYQFHRDWKNKQHAESSAAVNTPQAINPQNTLQVANQRLFGDEKTALAPETMTQAPATRLNLILIGVIAAQDNGISKVIIQIDNSDVGVYSVGDKLPKGNATIEKIEATQVLLRRSGKLESLAIIRPELENTAEEVEE
ncbi:MAG: type II secretion system protein N [Arenicellales bacterium]